MTTEHNTMTITLADTTLMRSARLDRRISDIIRSEKPSGRRLPDTQDLSLSTKSPSSSSIFISNLPF